jgi:hypothetical protein
MLDGKVGLTLNPDILEAAVIDAEALIVPVIATIEAASLLLGVIVLLKIDPAPVSGTVLEPSTFKNVSGLVVLIPTKPDESMINLSSFEVPFEIAKLVPTFPLTPTFHSGVCVSPLSKEMFGALFP